MVNDLSTHEELESKAAQSTLEIMFRSELMFYYLIQWELFGLSKCLLHDRHSKIRSNVEVITDRCHAMLSTEGCQKLVTDR